MDAEALYRTTGWTSNGDINTATIIYPGDANYSFDIEYVDLALHEMADYPTEYFTVDTSMPENLEVSYSTSVLDTILANISFGFYNARMTVRVTAVDRISGVHGFDYGYLRADGVSAVNAELAEQPIEEAQISFSEGEPRPLPVSRFPRRSWLRETSSMAPSMSGPRTGRGIKAIICGT